MRLIEIKDKVRAVRIPNIVFDELMAVEVDTTDGNSPAEKHMLADEMQRAEQTGNVYKVPLSNDSKRYLRDKALPNMIDIATDNINKRLVKTLQTFQARLNATVES